MFSAVLKGLEDARARGLKGDRMQVRSAPRTQLGKRNTSSLLFPTPLKLGKPGYKFVKFVERSSVSRTEKESESTAEISEDEHQTVVFGSANLRKGKLELSPPTSVT